MTVEELVAWVCEHRADVTLRYWHPTHTVRVSVEIPPRGRTHAEHGYLLAEEGSEVADMMAKVLERARR